MEGWKYSMSQVKKKRHLIVKETKLKNSRINHIKNKRQLKEVFVEKESIPFGLMLELAVAVADAGLGHLMIMAVLTREQLQDIANTSYVDERILKEGVIGTEQEDDAIVFDEKASLSDGDISDI